MTNKTFETAAEAEEFCLAQFCTPCKMKFVCNYELSRAKGSWRQCLGVKKGLCLHYSKRMGLSCCDSPTAPKEHGLFCPGKQCKDLPEIVIEEEQKTPTFYFGAPAPEGKDYKKLSAGDVDDVPF